MNKKIPFYLCNPFRTKPIILKPKFVRWRNVARIQKVSKEALKRLEWIIFYETIANYNALFTARHFGIARKTL